LKTDISTIAYQLRRSTRAKNTRIVVKPDVIEVVAPPHISARQIHAFVLSQQGWIKTAILRLASQTQSFPALAPDYYTEGAAIPYQGKRLPLRFQQGNAKSIRIQLQEDSHFVVRLAADTTGIQQSQGIRQALIRWMKQQARRQTGLLLQHYADRTGLLPRSYRIKTLKSRWGSCGPNNDININWLLLPAPPAALEYVIVHELCHIQHKNHSPAFWELVATHYPAYREQRLWLKQHGMTLMRGF
jgi:predicted metal-dependent hydrolase